MQGHGLHEHPMLVIRSQRGDGAGAGHVLLLQRWQWRESSVHCSVPQYRSRIGRKLSDVWGPGFSDADEAGGAATKVIGRSQTLSVEVGITTAPRQRQSGQVESTAQQARCFFVEAVTLFLLPSGSDVDRLRVPRTCGAAQAGSQKQQMDPPVILSGLHA